MIGPFFPVEIPAETKGAAEDVDAVCKVRFDVTVLGQVSWDSIEAACSRDDYVERAKLTVAGWIYPPHVVDGERRPRTGVSAQLRFRSPG